MEIHHFSIHFTYKARVIAFEPDPNSFKIAKENISLNPDLAERITLVNYAIGRDGIVEFPVHDDSSGSSIYENTKADKVKVRSVSISTILKEFNIASPYLLDIDIKGAEFEVIEDPSLSKFSRIRIEYSPYLLNDPSKSLQYIIQKLNNYGFNKVRIWKHNSLRFDLQNHGTIDAEK
ncbi:MAG: FkbM family methyltransferase [Candidatus Micrarchaeaceae archaeon]